MSGFWGTLGRAAGWLDGQLGTTVFGSTVTSTAMAATGWYNRNIAGTFLEDVGKNLATAATTQAISSATGGQQAGYSVPLPQGRSISGQSGVSPGKFSAAQAKQLGWSSPRVQEAYRKIANSSNREIAATMEIVRPNIPRKPPTKTLQEAMIG